MFKYNKPLNVIDILSYWIPLIAAVILISFSQCLKAADNNTGNLVTADWLSKNLQNENILILDASPGKIYTANHIPGAVNVNIFAFGVKETPVYEMENLFQSIGVSSAKKIVIYDQGGTMLATRLFYSLYYHNFPVENLYILDGGFFKWQEKGYIVSKDPPIDLPKGDFKINGRKDDARIKLPEFLEASGDLENNVLLEALEADWHFGKSHFFDRAGHIPNAVMLPVSDFFNPDKTFKSAAEIMKMLDYLGIKSEKQVLTHCGGGIAASVPFFVLKFILKYPGVKLFIESQMGWMKDERGLPFWTYDAPFLTRESHWLQSWGGKMLRMYGIAQVDIIDIRPQAEFNSGHLPFAVNIPAEIFSANIKNAAKLAEILGTSGINITYEAVIVSGAGLTKGSALAFVLLEMLGQKKVSVFMDSMEKCSQLGYSLTNDTTVLNSVNYSVNPHKDIITGSNETGKGSYPAVFIASGVKMPAKLPEGKVVNIPYTEFINSDGTPKEAKDIWTVITGAGITRYAELVCVSDDPGEAAVNYFIFKLMGFPDVKIIVV